MAKKCGKKMAGGGMVAVMKPASAMAKGGVVRGGGAAKKGLKFGRSC